MTPRGMVNIPTTAEDLSVVARWLDVWDARGRQMPATLLGPTRRELDAESARVQHLITRLRRATIRKTRTAIKLSREDARCVITMVGAAVWLGWLIPSALHRFAAAGRQATWRRGRPRRTVDQIEARIAAVKSGLISVGDDRDLRRDMARVRWLRWIESESARGRTLLTARPMPPRE